jgi:hypothetical protein
MDWGERWRTRCAIVRRWATLDALEPGSRLRFGPYLAWAGEPIGSHPLDGPRMKLDRARMHLESLEADIEAWRATQPEDTNDQERHEDRAYAYFHLSLPPKQLALAVGDFFHCVRAGLDHLAWQLALLTTEQPKLATEFPIYAKPNSAIERKVRELPEAAQELIRALQPYHKGDLTRDDALWIVHQADIADKHRLIVPMASQSFMAALLGDESKKIRHKKYPDGSLGIGVLHAGAALFKRQYQVAVYFVVPIDRDDPKQALAVSGEDLRDIYGTVANDVFSRFTHFFPDALTQ